MEERKGNKIGKIYEKNQKTNINFQCDKNSINNFNVANMSTNYLFIRKFG